MKKINIGPTKICPDCGIEKDLETGYFSSLSKRKSPWYSKRCKPCHNIYCKEYRKTKKHKRIYKKWVKSKRGRDVRKRGTCNWKKNNPLKYKASYLTSNAVRDGRLIPQPCMICGEEKAEAHHEDYSKPLDVMWMCKKCHIKHHYSWGE